MKRFTVAAALLLMLPVVSQAEIVDGLSPGEASSPHGGSSMSKPMQMPEGPTGEGKVISVVSGSGYSYVELEQNGKTVWVAGTQVAVAKGDTVSYIENVVMEKFYSKTMQREFDRIIFASQLQKK